MIHTAGVLSDFTNKVHRIRQWLSAQNYEAVLLSSQVSFAWLTGGRGFIATVSEQSCAKLLITPEHVYLITNNIEAQRLAKEELADLPLKILIYPWYELQGETIILKRLGISPVREQDHVREIARLRQPLTDVEQQRYVELGRDVGEAIEETCFRIKRGLSEYEIAAILSQQCLERQVEPVLLLVACDERAAKFRHPLPTGKVLECYAMIVVGGRRNGLIISATRLVHFGKIPQELKHKHQAVTSIDAVFIANTRPGQKVAEIFRKATEAYEYWGFPEEWKQHHQGGMTGYVGREYRATLSSTDIVDIQQVFAWNPSISGVKSEDTILVEQKENLILSRTGNFPEVKVEIDGCPVYRPDILLRQW
ncbi:M24 family metallopeptidase [Caldalkalibacillus thermarum]|uniref:M24 family metallopeptidase n=1 Tax=Caldalkalibacillus thermarum TaxID=296745 RepID=UPI00031F39AE|nr:M24 family metallopeptidase [Caldalkalibacillus thermarum]